MNLIWHIAVKDLRRTAPAALVWVASVLGVALCFWLWMRVSPFYVVSRFSGEEIFMTVVRGMQIVLAALIIGNTVLDDRIVGTDAFWLTRPIRRGQLLGGKALSGALLFIVAPLGVLLPLWLGVGFSASQTALAALEFIVPMVLTLAFALMVGGLSSSLGNFLFLAILLAIAHILCGAFAPTRGLTEHEAMAVRQSRNMIIQYAVLPGMVLVAVHQFFTHNRRRSFALLAGLLLLTLTVRLAWPWVILRSAPTYSDARTVFLERKKELEKADGSTGFFGEMPARVGATLRNEASRTEIFEIARESSSRVAAIYIRERDAYLFFGDGADLRETEALASRKGAVDVFLLKVPGDTTPRRLVTEEAGMATYASLLVASRKLHLPADLSLTEGQLARSTLVKLRFDLTQAPQTRTAGNKKT